MKIEDIRLHKREIFTPNSVQLREADNQDSPISGVAIVTDSETVLYEDDRERVIESIAPSCLAEDFIREQDIKLNLLHERSMSFARTPKSLRVAVEKDGLHFEADVPDCDLGKQARALIANGTYTGCSFEFWPQDYTVTEREGKDGKNEVVIRHTKFEAIDALTIAISPAYKETSVSARELLDEFRKDREAAAQAQAAQEAEQREAEEAAAKAAAQREQDARDREIAILQMKSEMLNIQ